MNEQARKNWDAWLDGFKPEDADIEQKSNTITQAYRIAILEDANGFFLTLCHGPDDYEYAESLPEFICWEGDERVVEINK